MGSTRLVFRMTDARRDARKVREVLARSLPHAAAPARLDWLYLGNPLGPSLVWLAEEEESGRAVGTSAAHRRVLRVEGRDVAALNLSDFAVDASYRTLGPALGLLRATLAAVDGGDFGLSYDVPSESMLALYKRLGYRELGRMQRWVRPLRLAPALARRGRPGALLGPLADAALRLRDACDRPPRAIEVTPLAGGFGPEFDTLEERERDRFPVRGARPAAYLEWRYARHTMWPHRTLCARRGGELCGYLVWRETEPHVLSVAELACGGDFDVGRALVLALAALGRRDGAAAIATQVLARSPAAALFARLRFVLRGDGPGPVAYAGARSGLPPSVYDAASWWFVEGDRDI